jgi:hypothetical protein
LTDHASFLKGPFERRSGRWGMLVVETIGQIRREHFVKGE